MIEPYIIIVDGIVDLSFSVAIKLHMVKRSMWCQQFDYFSKNKIMSHHILVFDSQKERGQNHTIVKFWVKSTINSKYESYCIKNCIINP